MRCLNIVLLEVIMFVSFKVILVTQQPGIEVFILHAVSICFIELMNGWTFIILSHFKDFLDFEKITI